MARKMKTMDGNHAAAHASYAYKNCKVYFTFHRVTTYYYLFLIKKSN